MSLSDNLDTAFGAVGADVGDLADKMDEIRTRWGPGNAAPVPNSNIDDIVSGGQYFVTNAVISGSPALSSIAAASGSCLLHFQYNSSNAAQIFVAHSGNNVYTRVKDSGTWTSFKQLARDENVIKISDLRPAGNTPGELIIGRQGTGSSGGDTLGAVLFYNGDSSTGGSGRRIGGSVKLEAEDAFGDADLVIGVGTSDPIENFGDPADFADNTIEAVRIKGENLDAEFQGDIFTKGTRVQKVGEFGPGSNENPRITDDINSSYPTGIYYAHSAAVNKYLGSNHHLLNMNFDEENDFKAQVAISQTTTPSMAFRTKHVGVWRDWNEVVTPTVLRKRYALLSDYVSDVNDSFDGMQAFLNDAEGREGVVDNPTGSYTNYLFPDRSDVNGDKTLTLPKKSRLIQEPGANLLFNWNTTDTQGIRAMQVVGDLGSLYGIDGNIAKGDTQFDLTSTTNANNLYSGQLLWISTDEQFTIEEGTLGNKGEWVIVAYTSGPTVHLVSGVQDSYSDSGNNLGVRREVDMVDLTFEGFRIDGPGQLDGSASPGDRGIHVGNARKLVMRDCEINGFDFQGVLAAGVYSGLIDNITVKMYDEGNNEEVSYGIALANAIHKFDVINSRAYGGREAMCMTVTGSTWGALGTTRNINFINNLAAGARRTGYASHDNHENIQFIGNRSEDCNQGFDCRIGRARFTDNVVIGTQSVNSLDCGFQFGSGAHDLYLSGNYMENVLRGHWMPDTIRHEVAPGNIVIDGDVVRSTKQGYGTLLAFNGSTDAGYVTGDTQLGTLTIKNVDYNIGDGGGSRAVEVHGKWTNPIIEGELRGGNGAQSVYLRPAESNNSAGNGPVGASVKVRYESTFTAPLIQHGTGIVDLDLKGFGFRAPGETWQDNVYYNPPSLAPGQSTVLGITLVGVDVGDSIQIHPVLPDQYMTYHCHATGPDAATITATNSGSATLNGTGGQFYFTITKRKS